MKRFLVAATLVFNVAAQSDTECGNATLQPVPGAPNVLIVGDSISMAVPYTPGGYGINIQQILGQKGVPVQHAGGWYAGGQCSNSVKGLLCTNSTTRNNYLNFTGIFDVIHMNYGLHDLVTCNDNPECSEHVDIATYGQNLVTLYQRFATKATTVIWTSTTPVPNVTTSLGRSYQLAVEYNAQAIKSLSAAVEQAQAQAQAGQVNTEFKGHKPRGTDNAHSHAAWASQHGKRGLMRVQDLAGHATTGHAVAGRAQAPGLVVDDLWQAVIDVCGAYYTNCTLQIPVNVHFEPAGQALLGQHAANSILSVLAAQGWRQDQATGQWTKLQ